MGLTRTFACFVTADNSRTVTGTCWILDFPTAPNDLGDPDGVPEGSIQERVIFQPGDAREVPGLLGLSGHVVLQDGTLLMGRLTARDEATLLLSHD